MSIAACLSEQPPGLSAAEREAIRKLAADIPALWQAPTTTAALRKARLGQVVRRVVVAVQGESERVRVTIEWVGGTQTAGEIVRPVGRLEQLSYYPQLCARTRELAQAGLTTAAIAQRLNAEGYRPPKRREQFGPQGVQELLERQGVSSKSFHPVPHPERGTDEWGLRELAQVVGMPHVTLYNWICRGWVRARREEQAPWHWIVWADAAEIARLRQQHQRSVGNETHDRWCREIAQAADHVILSE